MQVDLTVATPSGITLAIHAWLTGKIDVGADGFTVASVEVWFFAMVSRLQSDGMHEIKGPNSFALRAEKVLWVKPEDLCIEGAPIKHVELIAEAARVREEAEQRAQRPSLGMDWP